LFLQIICMVIIPKCAISYCRDILLARPSRISYSLGSVCNPSWTGVLLKYSPSMDILLNKKQLDTSPWYSHNLWWPKDGKVGRIKNFLLLFLL
jgi:hypothetical protein